MAGKSNSIESATESLLTNIRMLWYIRFPLGLMCLMVLLGPIGLIFFARFLGTAIVANSVIQVASLAFICLMASTLAMIQISFILHRGQYWLDDEHVNHTRVYRFFQQIQSRLDSKTSLPALNWLLLGWKWPLKPTLILFVVGFSLPFWCSLNSLLHRANQNLQENFTDEPVASWSNAILGLLLGFGLFLVMVQLMGVLQTLFVTSLQSKSQLGDQSQHNPFEHHPVSSLLNLRPTLAINLKPLPHGIRNLLTPFLVIHHELIFWGLTVISIYGLIFFQTNSQVIDSEHGYTAVFYLILWLLLIESIFAAIAFFFDRYRMPALLLVLIFFGIYQIWVPYDHRFATIPVTKSEDSKTIQSKSCSTDIRTGSKKIKIIVVAPGGGIHASAWTGTVLAGLHERYSIDFEDSLHLISAVSGGSVGTMYYLDHFESLVANNPSRDITMSTESEAPKTPNLAVRGLDYRKTKYESGLDVVRRRSSTSSLESLFWGLTFPDTFRIFNPWWAMMDRGDAQESLFRERLDLEKEDIGPTLLGWRQRAEKGLMPYVVFNATEANTGQRVLFSTLPLPNRENAAGKFDLGRSDWKPKNFLLLSDGRIDVQISTAVRLSATFPYISPASRPTPESNIELGHVVDGGYADNEGLITAIEEINRLTEITTDAKKNDSEDNSKLTIVLIRIAHQPKTEPLLAMDRSEESRGGGLEYAAFGPLLAAMNVRDSSQKERGEIELRLLRGRLNETRSNNNNNNPEFREVTLRFQSNGNIEIPPLNWKLLPKQRSAYQAAWAEIVEDACRTTKTDDKVGEGLQILDSLFNYKVKDDCSKSSTESP